MGRTCYAAFLLDTDGRVVSWNMDAEALKGYEPEEIIGKHFSVLYPPESVTAKYPQSELKQAADTGFHIADGWRICKDGSRCWAHVFTTPQFDADGALVGFIRVIRDDTARLTER